MCHVHTPNLLKVVALKSKIDVYEIALKFACELTVEQFQAKYDNAMEKKCCK